MGGDVSSEKGDIKDTTSLSRTVWNFIFRNPFNCEREKACFIQVLTPTINRKKKGTGTIPRYR